MANNGQKEAWIDEVMGSIHGMERAQPPVGLYSKVMAGIQAQPAARVIAMPVTRWAAAAILLLALNIGSVFYVTTQNKKTTPASAGNALASELQTVSTYNY
jgi:hypothetical protein